MDLVDRHYHGTAVTGYSAQNIDNIIHQVHCYIDLQQCSAENFVLSNKYGTVACIIVRRLLISVHKWQSSGMADTHEYWSQHDAHLVYLPIFHGLNLIIFS